jgi:hypothetical protein
MIELIAIILLAFMCGIMVALLRRERREILERMDKMQDDILLLYRRGNNYFDYINALGSQIDELDARWAKQGKKRG